MKQGWEYKKFTDVCDVLYGYAFDSKYFTDDENAMPLIRIRDVMRGYSETFYNGYFPEGFTINEGDYLVGMDGEFNIGRWGKIPGLLNQRVCKMKSSSPLLNNQYMYYFLKVCLKGIEDETPFVTVKHLSAKRINQIQIPLPPLSIQQSIVAELDEINNLLQLKKKELETFDKLAQSIFYEMFGDPVTNEKGWEVKKLGEIGTIVTGSTPSTKIVEYYSSNDFCFVKPSDLPNEGYKVLKDSEYHISSKGFEVSRKLPKGTVLVSCIGIIGKTAILGIEACTNQQINAIIPNNSIDNRFLTYSILSQRSRLSAIANAPVVPLINKGEFSKVETILPPLSLQQTFATRIKAIEQQKEQVKASINKLETLLASRMQYWFD